jgi:PAT family beta-lactamase induction signal transducer AmpG
MNRHATVTESPLKPSMLRVFASWRLAVVLLMGFSSGLPLALTGVSLQAWMTSRRIDLSVIGLVAGVTLPYSLKFLWSPLMDRFVPPFLGRRRGWMIVSQIALVAGIVGMALAGASAGPAMIAVLALAVAFFSASQDIAIDAYRTEILYPEELGAGAGLAIMGYRIGMICSGALAMILADHLSWQSVYLLMAAGMSVGVVTALLAPEPVLAARPPQTLARAVVLPFREFLSRRGAVEMLLFILIYKLDAAMVANMMTPFLLGAGFTQTDIGAVTNGLGIFATIAGATVGGAVVTRLGIHRSLWTFGLLQGLAGLSFTLLAVLGHHYPMMVAAIVVENLCSGMATASFAAFIMGLCNKRFTATQYALLTSLMALGGRVLAGMPAGWFAKQVGWPSYFMVATFVAIPGLLLLLRYPTWQRAVPVPAERGLRS